MISPRVLHVITAISRGGAENHLWELVRLQKAAGMEVSVAYLRGDFREFGVPVHPLGLRFYGDLRPLLRLRRLIARGGFDLVHAHLPPAELYCRLALLGVAARDLPLVITKHNDAPFFSGPGQRALGRWVARRASSVIAISAAVSRYMAGPQLGLPAAQLHTVHYGIDPQPFAAVPDSAAAALRESWGVPADALLIGFAGRLTAQKSLETLLRSFALFASGAGEKSWLALVGEGELGPSLRQLAAELGIADRVVWPGFREDMPAVMRAFDVFALTSIYEGFGLVLLEAMAAARPVVATRAGAIPEVVADGTTGLLVDAAQPAALAAAFERMRDADLRARLGTSGRQRASEHFTLTQMSARTAEVYARCLAAPQVAAPLFPRESPSRA